MSSRDNSNQVFATTTPMYSPKGFKDEPQLVILVSKLILSDDVLEYSNSLHVDYTCFRE